MYTTPTPPPTLIIISPLRLPLMSRPAFSLHSGTADLAGWNIPFILNECRRCQTRLDRESVLNMNEDHSLICAFITDTILCRRWLRMFLHTLLLCAYCTPVLLRTAFSIMICVCVCVCVCRSVWRCCAATVNRTSRGGTSVIALFMTWQLMTAKIYLKTSVSGLLCECVCLHMSLIPFKEALCFLTTDFIILAVSVFSFFNSPVLT